ncbi:hypothetical protein ABE38_10065 [Brevibacillus agri]|nr:hypothetical protein [Brevibacillus agri]
MEEITACLFTTSSWMACFACLLIAAGSWKKAALRKTPEIGIIWICSIESEHAPEKAGLLFFFFAKKTQEQPDAKGRKRGVLRRAAGAYDGKQGSYNGRF